MAKPYSADLRWRVVGTIEGGTTIPEAAEQCGVSTVVRFLKLHRETASVDPNVLESVARMIGNIVDFGLSS
jgi:hypothetical protein